MVPLEREHGDSAAALRSAGEAVTDAEQARDEARAAREHAWLTHRAAALRSELVTGQACPVCDQMVATLPAAVDAPELAGADKAVRALDRTVTTARAAQAKASNAETAMATRLATARQHVAALTERLAGRPQDPAALGRTLTEIDALGAASRSASVEVRTRRAEHHGAVAAAHTLEAEAADTMTALRGARDPLVVMGAPSPDEADLLGAWTGLADWAGRQAGTRRTRQRAQQVALAAAEQASAQARDRFAAADERAGAAQRAVNEATEAAAATRAAVDNLQARADELTAALARAPSVGQATEQLRRVDEMTTAVRDSDAALAAAAAGRSTAAAALDTLTARVGQAWRNLRTVRDSVIGLGAPDLPEGSALAGWTTLAAWASAAARARASALPDAQDAVTAATRHRDEAAKHLTDEFAALDVAVDGDLADTAPAAAAAELAQARGDRRRIAERRAQATAVEADLAKAQEEQQVARMLGNLLRSNQFPEWLEAAALDTLVADASVRLAELSNGQFELTHRDRGVLRHRPRRRRQPARRPDPVRRRDVPGQPRPGAGVEHPAVVDGRGRRRPARLDLPGRGLRHARRRPPWRSSPPPWRTSPRATGWSAWSPTSRALADRIPVRFLVRGTPAPRRSSGNHCEPPCFALGLGMRFAVDGWDPGYGSSFEVDEELTDTTADVEVAVEVPRADWRPLGPTAPVTVPSRVLFVDGVRRIEARAWIDDPPDPATGSGGGRAGTATEGICASYAAGVVCCYRHPGAPAGLGTQTGPVHRGLARPEHSNLGGRVRSVQGGAGRAAAAGRGAVARRCRRRLAELELGVARQARANPVEGGDVEDDLLVIDGPLHGRTGLPRAVGYIKSHHSAYLPRELHAMVGRLQAGQRTPVFHIGNGWDRHSWYLRLPGSPGAPWAGVVRVECSPDLTTDRVVALANLTQAVLPRYASAAYKDTRAPQNLYPIAGLERELRRRLGDPRLLYRALRVAAAA